MKCWKSVYFVIDKVYVLIQGFRSFVMLNSDGKFLQIYFIKKLGVWVKGRVVIPVSGRVALGILGLFRRTQLL